MSALLLDTHALLWWWTDDPRLSTTVRQALLDEQNTVHVSAASAWEIATKQRLGKLGLAQAVASFDQLVQADGFLHLPMTWHHAQRAGSYPQPHRDPFDRMLAAQAELERLKLVTADPELTHFPVSRLW
jgi:PIN domain nuclease of toxin-antitoxin system